jgi:hypothetical protein
MRAGVVQSAAEHCNSAGLHCRLNTSTLACGQNCGRTCGQVCAPNGTSHAILHQLMHNMLCCRSWKPRLLEGLQQRFRSIAKTCNEPNSSSSSGASPGGSSNPSGSENSSNSLANDPVLSFKAFQRFWDTRMLHKRVKPQVTAVHIGASAAVFGCSVIRRC